ncbi:DUF4212 family protein [Natrialba magadii ATCC 43099]|uniref:DUF4212 family protein n=1 Tax=Natrialba magadii (strain ATCC 43099 / DSM 3394 / CCM 3739 / CIP 104546 / IAM 13178 / JCM 8861 / NBRC 102185 / NCIMB 2190 / MS3) TaxID=547559 RepID=D3SRU4_NATMM|nr:DUF4212 domain-containing protein [Natrialba magadii]ADD06718.1 DUF4212 family protein [Natrialba magadii ATCC 43099]ELY32138.1 solute symporter protein [Natrialba magadii ATCC 43099]
MADDNTQSREDARTDGGVTTDSYLDKEINIFKPATPFMRDHLRVIWLSFAAWVVVVFGPTTAVLIESLWLETSVMTETTILGGFPLHFFLAAIVTPLGALVLSVGYAMQRDRLDTRYGISHEDGGAGGTDPDADTDADSDSDTVAADGGAK